VRLGRGNRVRRVKERSFRSVRRECLGERAAFIQRKIGRRAIGLLGKDFAGPDVSLDGPQLEGEEKKLFASGRKRRGGKAAARRRRRKSRNGELGGPA